MHLIWFPHHVTFPSASVCRSLPLTIHPEAAQETAPYVLCLLFPWRCYRDLTVCVIRVTWMKPYLRIIFFPPEVGVKGRLCGELFSLSQKELGNCAPPPTLGSGTLSGINPKQTSDIHQAPHLCTSQGANKLHPWLEMLTVQRERWRVQWRAGSDGRRRCCKEPWSPGSYFLKSLDCLLELVIFFL